MFTGYATGEECNRPISAEKLLISGQVGEIGAQIPIKDPKCWLRISGDPISAAK
jgi:hypothetical protein